MKYLIIAGLGLSLVACDKVKELGNKAKDLANKAKTTAEGKASDGAASKPSIADPELQKLVDQTAEGVVFRKDLPFPRKLEVKTTLREEIDARIFQNSLIENRVAEWKGTQMTVTKLERIDDFIRYTLEQSSFTLPVIEGAEAPKKAIADPLAKVAEAAKPVVFKKTNSGWGSASNDFRAAVLARELAPFFDSLLIENCLAPRSLWFGKNRIKAGDEIKVTGSNVPMILCGKSMADITLTYQGPDAVEGHPCGVFKVKGNYKREKFPDFEGKLADEDTTIESGKIWLSLLYPMILKQELETIQSRKSGTGGAAAERSQGKIQVSLTRQWKVTP